MGCGLDWVCGAFGGCRCCFWKDFVVRVSHLYAIDLDGTLLTDRKSFDRVRFGEALAGLAEVGACVAIATGNQLPKVLEYMEGFEGCENLFLIAENGAVIHHGGEDLVVWGFPDGVAEQVLAVVDERYPELGVVISGRFRSFVPEARVGAMAELLVSHFDEMGMVVPGYDPAEPITAVRAFYVGAQVLGGVEDLDDRVVKIALNTPSPADVDGILAELGEVLPAGVVATHSGFGAIDVIVEGNHKGHGVAWLAESLGLGAESVTAFGDSPNDLEMFEFVGRAVGMEEVADSLLPFVDVRIGSNNDGAVVDFLLAEVERGVGGAAV